MADQLDLVLVVQDQHLDAQVDLDPVGSGGGCGVAITPTGSFRTLSFLPGWIQVPLGEMYNSVFFIGTAFAMHGDTYVPLAPVSHGCVRLPMDIAAFFHTLLKIPGEPVIIRRP